MLGKRCPGKGGHDQEREDVPREGRTCLGKGGRDQEREDVPREGRTCPGKGGHAHANISLVDPDRTQVLPKFGLYS